MVRVCGGVSVKSAWWSLGVGFVAGGVLVRLVLDRMPAGATRHLSNVIGSYPGRVLRWLSRAVFGDRLGFLRPARLSSAEKKRLKYKKRVERRREKQRLRADRAKGRSFPEKRRQQSRQIEAERKKRRMEKQKIYDLCRYAYDHRDTNWNIVVDCEYELPPSEKLVRKTISSLIRQLQETWGVCRKEEWIPPTIVVVGMNDQIRSEYVRRNGDKWLMHFTSKSLLELYNPDELIYLSPDSSIPLINVRQPSSDNDSVASNETKNTRLVYVIGGIIDSTVSRHQTLNRSNEYQIENRRLPIVEYLSNSRKGKNFVLNIDTVVELLIRVYHGSDWNEAFDLALPKRIGKVTSLRT